MDDTLRRLQLTQLEMLKVFDHICRTYHLRYSLYGGTLLGAVRHRGFIPWDDDLDVCMPRADYNRFIELWDTIAHEGYILQNKDNTPDFTQSFTKIRKLNTTFEQEYDLNKHYHKGIFIDIFPIDRKQMGKVSESVRAAEIMLYQLMVHEFAPKDHGRLTYAASKMILEVISPKYRKNLRYRLLQNLTRYDNDIRLPVSAFETLTEAKRSYHSALLERYVELPFEDGCYLCFSEYTHYLEAKYGDYMQLPPIEDRMWKHRPVKIDFDREVWSDVSN